MEEAVYHQVKVEFEEINEKGNLKKFKTLYLVDSMTCTEAEAKVVTHLKDTTLEYRITEVKKSLVESVF
jgi:hypothetical protein